MGLCCSLRRMDNSLQHGLNVNDQSDADDDDNNDNNNNNNNHMMHEQEQKQEGNNNNNNNMNDMNEEQNESSLNTMSVTISHITDHPIQDDNDNDDDDDDDDDDDEYEEEEEDKENKDDNDITDDGDNRYRRLLNRMQRRKNLKSYLTTVKKSKKQLITKKKKLKELLLDKSNEKEYNTAFDTNITPNAPKFKKLSSRTTFPEISFTEWIIKEGVVLNDIINEIYNITPHHDTDNDDDDDEDGTASISTSSSSDNNNNNNNNNDLYIGYIPEEISITIISYTLDLLPGIYEFVGIMDYNGTDDESESNNYTMHRNNGWGIYGLGGGNYCRCQIILNSRAEIIGGHFSENSFKYHITNGSYTYHNPYCIEFTKEYFNYNYKYKVYGQITRDNDENLQFKGYWKLLDGERGGNVKMDYVQNTKYGVKQNEKLKPGKYQFYGHCDYLPNTDKRYLFDDRQRIKCYLTLNANDFRINGIIKLLKGTGYHGLYRTNYIIHNNDDDDNDNNNNNNNDNDSDDAHNDEDENDNIFVIDEKESEWDIYGGLHIQLINGYIMEGFFNGEDFMGVWKDEDFARFGHFQYEIFTSCDDEKNNTKTINTKDLVLNENNDNQYDEEEKEDILISPKYLLTRAKSLDSDEDHADHQEDDID